MRFLSLVLGGVLLFAGASAAYAQGGPYGEPRGGPYGNPYADSSYVQQETRPVVGDISFLGGGKTLGGSWDPDVQDHVELALLFDIKSAYWPVAFAADLRVSVSDTDPFTFVYYTTTELNLGVRHIIQSGSVLRPYIGGGVSLASVSEYDEFTDTELASDSGTGVWLGAGVYLDLSRYAHLGLDFAWSDVDGSPTPFGGRNLGGRHIGLMLGLHWR